jgi:hypothetical protein
MLTPSCVRLSTLANILREEYRRKSALSAESPDPGQTKEADANIARAHDLLRQHREYCPLCKAYEREAAMQSLSRKPVSSEYQVFKLDKVI